MSSPVLSPLSDRIARLRQLGSQAVDAISHPITSFQHMIAPADHDQMHQNAIEQMNRGLNDQRVQQTNQSFQKPNLSTMKKPLGK